MRVGLDGIPLANPRTGVGHYTFELARHLAIISAPDEFELLSPFSFNPPLDDHDLPAGLRAVQVKVNSLSRRWFAVGLPLHLRHSKFDLFHGTNYEVPLWSKSPSVLTVHDLSLFLLPETHEPHLVRRGRRRLPIMARRADCLITPSQTIKREVIQHLRIGDAQIVVIPDAPRSVFRPMPLEETVATRTKLGIEPEFILFTGTLEPRKNLTTLLKAFDEIMRKTALRPQLVIAGKEGWLMDELRQQMEQRDLKDRLRFTGYLPDDELRALYSSCRVFVYPSLYEGFGLPPLEAMACGAPVITSSISSLIETTGTEAARHVAALDVEGLAQSIVGLLENDSERKYLSSAGIKHAAGFSWHKVAASTLEVYRQVMKQKSVSVHHS